MSKFSLSAMIGCGALALALAGLIAMPGNAQRNGTATRSGEAAPPPLRPVVIGVNLGKLTPWAGEYAFANLLQASSVAAKRATGWSPPAPGQLDQDGWPTAPSTVSIEYVMGAPNVFERPRIRCSWSGGGTANLAGGNMVDIEPHPDHADFTWNGREPSNNWVDDVAQPHPAREIDCRERDLDKSALFAPIFLKTAAPFKVLRFVDWQAINDNHGGGWAKRSTPSSATQAGPDGVSIEAIVALVNQTGADPWIIVPYHADDDYITRMATYVHAKLHAGGTVYVEFGNEIWNSAFPAAREAQGEGLAEHLSADPNEARLRRYAEKASHALAIWTRVFADRPHALVRVLATQNAWPQTAELALSFRDTAHWIDALATAPYFGGDILSDPAVTTPDAAFARMDAAIDQTLGFAAQNQAIARRYGKRYITYEGGQGLASGNMALLTAIERDPRMEAAYTRYLRAWQSRFGDLMMLYNLTDRIGGSFGAWGLQEQTGQPESETPKLRAVRAFIGR